jgi:hypothetical protein
LILNGQNKNVCNQNLKTFLKICNTVGVPIKEEKTAYAQTTMTGIELDLLSFACCVVQPGRTFLRKIIDRTKGIQQPHFHIRLNKENRLEIVAWLLVIGHCNGKTVLLKQIWISTNKLHLYTDAARSLGFGSIFQSEWIYGSWSELVKDYPITYKELYPIVVSIAVWGSQLASLVFHSDSMAVVYIINKQTSKDPHIMRLIRRFGVACIQYNILPKAVHIQGN